MSASVTTSLPPALPQALPSSTTSVTISTGNEPPSQPPLSKNARKRKLKNERYLEKKKMKKELRKKQRAESRKIREEEELPQPSHTRKHNSDNIDHSARRAKEKAEREAQFLALVTSAPRVIMDLDFEEQLTAKEKKSMTQQLMYCYALNKKS